MSTMLTKEQLEVLSSIDALEFGRRVSPMISTAAADQLRRKHPELKGVSVSEFPERLRRIAIEGQRHLEFSKPVFPDGGIVELAIRVDLHPVDRESLHMRLRELERLGLVSTAPLSRWIGWLEWMTPSGRHGELRVTQEHDGVAPGMDGIVDGETIAGFTLDPDHSWIRPRCYLITTEGMKALRDATPAEPAEETQTDSLSPTESKIVRMLFNFAPDAKLQIDIAEKTGFDRKTVSKQIRGLIERGLVVSKNGGKSGFQLTDAGLNIAATLKTGP